MTLNRLVDIELSVMTPSDVEEAVQIAKRQHPSGAQLSAQDYAQLGLPRLTWDLLSNPVIVGKEKGVVVAVYEVPVACGVKDGALAFGRIKTLPTSPWPVSKFIYRGDCSCFAAVDEDQVADKAHISRAFFGHLGKILEEVAFRVNSPIIHRIDANHPQERFFQAIGYAKVHEFQGLPWDTHVWEHRYEPHQQSLAPNEGNVADGLCRIIAIHARLPYEPLKQTI